MQELFLLLNNFIMKHILAGTILFATVFSETTTYAQNNPFLSKEYALALPDKKKLKAGDTTGAKKSAYVIEATAPYGIKRKVRKNLDELTFQGGVGMVIFTGGKNAPYSTGYGINFGVINPYHKKHFALEYLFNFDYCTNPSKSWNARTVGTTTSNIASLSAGYNLQFGLGLSGIVINKRKFAMILGPELMYQSMFLSDMKLKVGDAALRETVVLTFAPGLKATAYVGDRLKLDVEYSNSLKKNISYEDYDYTIATINTPISLKYLRIGAGFRF